MQQPLISVTATPSTRGSKKKARTPKVARVIHQTWKHASLRWPLSACADSFRKWNPDWEYRLWTDEECEKLIAEELPEFYPTYLAYPKGIFRADIFRVAVLYLRGGVYADLDVECLQPLDDLIQAVGDGKWEVLLARDHPAHEKLHWQDRAMWMNAFFVAKAGSRFLKDVLAQYARNLELGCAFDDVVGQTGPGLFSRVIEHSGHGVYGYGIRPLPWRWIYPLPNVFVHVPQTAAYKQLIHQRTWRDGEQVPMEDYEEGKPEKAGLPFVAHYWWHSYIEGCREVNMLLRYAPFLLQTDGEIVERRLQRWLGTGGDWLDAAGQALAQFAEAGSGARGAAFGQPELLEPAPSTGNGQHERTRPVKFRALAEEVLSGLPAQIAHLARVSVSKVPAWEGKRPSAEETPGWSLLVFSADTQLEAGLKCLEKLLRGDQGAPKAMVLLVGQDQEGAARYGKLLAAASFSLTCDSGGWLWERAGEEQAIPRIIHLFQSKVGLSRAQEEISANSWAEKHAGGGWEVRRWTIESLRKLVEELEPGFMDTFAAYPDDLTRWGAARYLVLRAEGGVVVDPRTCCLQSLEPLLLVGHTAWVAGGTAAPGATQPLSDAAIASRAAHPLWSHIVAALERHARGTYAQAVGGEFLTHHARESYRYLPRPEWPAILPAECFGLPQWPPQGDGRDLPSALPNVYAAKWEKCPPSIRETLLVRTSEAVATTISPRVKEAYQRSGWEKFYPALTEEHLTAFREQCEPDEKKEIEDYFAVEDVIHRRESEQVIATSLFWKNVDVGDPDLPTPTLHLLQNAKQLGLSKRFDPWKHYVLPLVRGARKLAQQRPEATVRVYLARDLDFLIPMLQEDCEVHLMRHSSLKHNPGAMWRFLAMEDAFDGLTVIDADRLEDAGTELLDRTVKLPSEGVMSWREVFRDGTKWELCGDRHYFQYRPIIGCAFGSRVRLPARRLMEAFVWHHKRRAFRLDVTLPDGKTAPHFQHPWPGYSGDEWYLATSVYPRILPDGVLTYDYKRIISPVSIADAALNAMTHPRSRRASC